MRVRKADSAAWREFDAIYRPMLLRYGRARGLDEADAEDVVQYCMAAIHRHINSFDYDPAKGRFKGWLRTLVNNRVRNLIRGRHEQLAETKDFKRSQQREQSPEQIFDEMWMEQHLRRALQVVRGAVEPSTFKAFERYVLDECPVDQVCDELNMTPNQIYKVKWRVTQKLNDTLKYLIGDEA
jgi:RNA polymerase sigma-70 factor (ECF subfamily)